MPTCIPSTTWSKSDNRLVCFFMAYINFHLRHSGYSENTLRTLQQLNLPICKVLNLIIRWRLCMHGQIRLTIDNLYELKIFEEPKPFQCSPTTSHSDGKCSVWLSANVAGCWTGQGQCECSWWLVQVWRKPRAACICLGRWGSAGVGTRYSVHSSADGWLSAGTWLVLEMMACWPEVSQTTQQQPETIQTLLPIWHFEGWPSIC